MVLSESTTEMRKSALDFMMYSYFGASLKERADEPVLWQDLNSVDDCILTAVKKAYNDATLRGAYSGMIDSEASKNAKRNCVNYLVYGIAPMQGADRIISVKTLLTENPEKNFTDNHEIICDEIVKMHDHVVDNFGEKCFTYGNAQKWINMTTKYLYLMAGLIGLYEEENLNAIPENIKEFFDKVEVCSKYFHIPIDQIIMRSLLKLQSEELKKYIYSNGEGIACSITEKIIDGKNKEYIYKLVKKGTTGVKKIPWSKIGTYEMYKDFRKKIESAIRSEFSEVKSLIAWENEAWIDQSKTDSVLKQ